MKVFKGPEMWSRNIALLLLAGIFVAGCGREPAQSPFPPRVISETPADGSVDVLLASTVTATFSTVMAPATINTTTFTVTAPGGVPVAGAVSLNGGEATFAPASTLAGNTLFTATITTGAEDPGGNALASNFVWSFKTGVAPTVSSTVPANGAPAVAVNTMLSATFSEAMDSATINDSTFLLMGVGATPVAGAVNYAGTTATFTPTADLAANTTYTATITTGATDVPGNPLGANFVWSFTTALPSPAVTSTNPARGATNVLLNRKITATFNQAMNGGTVMAAGTVTVVVTAGGAPVAGAVTYDGASNTAVFTPAAVLAINTEFTARITTAALSAGGTALASDYVWNFTTGVTTDTTGPTVTSTNPGSGDTSVPLNQKITATFSEAMNPATISLPGTVTVVITAGSIPVPGTVTYDTTSDTVVFTPVADLEASTQYTATISAVAADLAGNLLTAGAVPNPWSFTTGTALNDAVPAITLTSPVSTAMSVPTDTTISATFSAPMDPTTITNATFTVAEEGVGGAPVNGTVAYDVASQIATFTPSVNLFGSTTYTATISNTLTDISGNALAEGVVPNPWSFTTGPGTGTGPQSVNLGAATSFGAVGGGAGITNQGLLTVINGDIGTTGVSTVVTGFHDAGPGCTYTETILNAGLVNGSIDTAAPPPTVGCPSEGTAATLSVATQALADANTAFINLSPAVLPGGTDPFAGQLGGHVFAPGIYKSASGTFLITGSDLTLDAQGDANAVWVFQASMSLTVGDAGTPRSVQLINGAQAKNVYWQVGSAATINPAGGGTMVGTIIASAGVTFSTAGNVAITTLNGRALGLNASVTMVNTAINVPAP